MTEATKTTAPGRMVIEDGSTWLTAERLGDLEHRLRYGRKAGTPPTEMDELTAATAISNLLMLLTHQAGTEAMVRKLRMLRRAVKSEREK